MTPDPSAVEPLPAQPRSPLDPEGLVDVLDTLLDQGAVVSGDVVISLAGVDLIYLDLRVLLASVATLASGATKSPDRDG